MYGNCGYFSSRSTVGKTPYLAFCLQPAAKMFGFSFYLKLIICSVFQVWQGRKTMWPPGGVRGPNLNLGGFVPVNVDQPGHAQFVTNFFPSLGSFMSTHIIVWEAFAQIGTFRSASIPLCPTRYACCLNARLHLPVWCRLKDSRRFRKMSGSCSVGSEGRPSSTTPRRNSTNSAFKCSESK